jgi:hypothetical protein
LPTLDTIGHCASGPQFVALMPGALAAAPARTTDVAGQITRELSRLLAAQLAPRRHELARCIAHGPPAHTPWDDVVVAAVADRRAPRISSLG